MTMDLVNRHKDFVDYFAMMKSWKEESIQECIYLHLLEFAHNLD